jgi:hypothetical protein
MSAPAPVICAAYDLGHLCTKARGHVGEHAAITVSGVTRHRWTQTTPGDAVTDRAPASSGAPSLVLLDLREAALEKLAEKAIAWADTDPDDDEGRDTERDLLTAIAAYREVAR